MSKSDQAKEAAELAAEIRPMLAGRGPEVQGATLLALVSMFIAGHHPDLRDGQIAIFFTALMAVIPITEKEMFGEAGFPTKGLQ